MASPPVLTPSGTTGYNIQRWKAGGAEEATYQAAVAIPIFDDLGRPLNQMNIRKHARMTASVLAQSADGDSITGHNPSGTAVTMTPAGNFIMIEYSANEKAQVDFDISNETQGEAENALAESSDQSVLANVATLTQTMSVAAITGSVWRQAVGRVMTNTNGRGMPGGTGLNRIYAILSTTQYPNVAAIEEFNNAQFRGDSENPYVKGIFTTAGGAMAAFTTVVTSDANGWHNFIGLSKCIGIGWNVRTMVTEQEDKLIYRLICFNNFGSTVQHDLRGIDLRTTASGL